MKVGFIGLGVMGLPMALNVARGGAELVIWNRTDGKYDALRELGAVVAGSPAEVFAKAEVVIVMLANAAAIDAVLMRDSESFRTMVAGRILVQMGTTAPAYSRALAAEVEAAGGQYVEAPVSGSRQPAESGQLVGMLAGRPELVAAVEPVIRSMCSRTFMCGAVPQALMTKLAVNLFLITMVTGLAEAFHFAESGGVDPAMFREILNAGPMASEVSRMKLAKLVEKDFQVQASIRDVAMNSSLVAQATRDTGAASPLLDQCDALFQESVAAGLGELDMAAVIEAIAARDE